MFGPSWARIANMSAAELQIRCQRCGTQMDMRDPGPGMPWTPDQFWVCAKCGRHFWSTYPPPNREKAKPAADAKPAAAVKSPSEVGS
jgi:DNA-directed RNA polymerase subunit RPC12/RpoP